jgi:NTE family protein
MHFSLQRALDEAGIEPKGIIGTSIGALVGALAAGGVGPDEGWRLALELERGDIVRVNRRAVWINGIRQLSIFHGDALRKHLERVLPSRGWAGLRLPFLVNTVNLADGATVWFGTGARTDISLVDAVYASCALPVFYPPFEHDGQAYVDGGTAHPLAINQAKKVGASRVIAVDVGAGREMDVDGTLDAGLLGVHQRVFGIMTYRRRKEALERWSGPPLLLVRPRLDGYGTFGFEHVPYFLEEGYRATREALAGLTEAPGVGDTE